MGDHSSNVENPPFFVRVGTWVKTKVGRTRKALGAFLGGSGATFLAQAQSYDWTHLDRQALVALASGLFGAIVVYVFPANKED